MHVLFVSPILFMSLTVRLFVLGQTINSELRRPSLLCRGLQRMDGWRETFQGKLDNWARVVRILVIGGTGFIGRSLTRQLAAQGHGVTLFHRGVTRATLPATVEEIIDPQSNLPICRFPSKVLNLSPDVVIHTMAMGAADADAAIKAFASRTGRFVLLSSGDVYRVYGRFIRIEPGPIENGLLTENSPLRSVFYPYRAKAPSESDLQYWYEKILAERAVLGEPGLPGTVLRLPKVYGPDGNANLATVYGYRNHPEWRWTHGYVENVAAAIVLAAIHPKASGRVYNVGESHTPTIAERLRTLPTSQIGPRESSFDFRHDLAYDATLIRAELGFREVIPVPDAMIATIEGNLDAG
jgi:nucleoside-diphosphate-sugar epimerase